MGYEVRLEKAGACGFTPQEWEAIRAEIDVDTWLHYHDGSLSVKNPSREQLTTLAALAKMTGSIMRGDDGEPYGDDGEPLADRSLPVNPLGILLDSLRTFLPLTPRREPGPPCPFSVGDRVATTFRTGGEIVGIDAAANHGLGSITVRFPDGSSFSAPFIGHDLKKEGAAERITQGCPDNPLE